MIEPSAEDLLEEARRAAAGEDLLFDLLEYLLDYVAFPSVEAARAVTLWVAHTHMVDHLETTPRLAVLSPHKQSGKTRLVECLTLVCRAPREAVNVTPAALFRMVSAAQPTLLFDECDTFFGPKAKEHEELRGLINSGHRRGAMAWRCVGDVKNMKVESFPSYCPVALAGIGDLPDTILDRAVLISMHRRRPDEQVRPFRHREAAPHGRGLQDRLAEWAAQVGERIGKARPVMPAGLVDRPADVWEPLLAVADAAGGIWSTWGREAATKLNSERQAADPSFDVKLLVDIQTLFDEDKMFTATLIDRLNSLDDSPWGALGKEQKPLDARGLAWRLSKYKIKSHNVRIGDRVAKGYDRVQFHDVWSRYCPAPATSATSATPLQPQVSGLSAVADVLPLSATGNTSATQNVPLTSTVTHVADVADDDGIEPGHSGTGALKDQVEVLETQVEDYEARIKDLTDLTETWGQEP